MCRQYISTSNIPRKLWEPTNYNGHANKKSILGQLIKLMNHLGSIFISSRRENRLLYTRLILFALKNLGNGSSKQLCEAHITFLWVECEEKSLWELRGPGFLSAQKFFGVKLVLAVATALFEAALCPQSCLLDTSIPHSQICPGATTIAV